MNSEKLVSNNEISSEESDHQEEAQDDTEGTKRSYECTFCKRGFTNAQALGGHMNIHRKDRAKAKQVITNQTNQEYFMAPPFASGFSNQTTRHYSILEPQSNCNMYFHPPPTPNHFRDQPSYAPNTQLQYDQCHNLSSRPMNLNQLELRGANLSLQVGPSHVDNYTNQVRTGTQEDDEVDLELRLGHDQY
ncbi:hypothetical protein Lal_00021617 [Lupinus albus]|uniref:Putative transcription factor C2H2 family n=1 Tax=Lupinus albus TaxID=3870 RepID=A0A6A4NK41_LUPAL|nr:putative transcription factor C2H2 family [Lupinus albus]KAF1860573.1 hypothetical protein Lal_00021617 [Lupinus albus]